MTLRTLTDEEREITGSHAILNQVRTFTRWVMGRYKLHGNDYDSLHAECLAAVVFAWTKYDKHRGKYKHYINSVMYTAILKYFERKNKSRKIGSRSQTNSLDYDFESVTAPVIESQIELDEEDRLKQALVSKILDMITAPKPKECVRLVLSGECQTWVDAAKRVGVSQRRLVQVFQEVQVKIGVRTDKGKLRWTSRVERESRKNKHG